MQELNIFSHNLKKYLQRKPPSNTILPMKNAANIFADKSNICNPKMALGRGCFQV